MPNNKLNDDATRYTLHVHLFTVREGSTGGRGGGILGACNWEPIAKSGIGTKYLPPGEVLESLAKPKSASIIVGFAPSAPVPGGRKVALRKRT